MHDTEFLGETLILPLCCSYGDKTPKSSISRILAVILTLVGLLTVALLSSLITTSLTVAVISGDVKLYGTKVIYLVDKKTIDLVWPKN